MMGDMMTFPDTWEEFEKLYGFNDAEEIYTNNSRLIPSFRVKQWLDHLPSVQPDKDLIHLQKEQAYMQGYEDGKKSRKGKWIRTRTMTHDGELYCDQCEQEHPEQKIIWNFCPNCGSYNGDSNNTKPKSCFECECSVDYDDDTVMCSEVKGIISISQNHDMIPPFCPKYVEQI